MLLSLAVTLLAAVFFAPNVFASDLAAEKVVEYQDLANGVAVMDDGIIYAAAGSSIKGFNENGVNVFSASLPAKCGNLCAYGDYLFAAGYMNGHMNEIYVLKPGSGSACTTLDAGERAQAVETDYSGYLYCINSTGTRSNGKKATKILRAKISDVVSLSSGDTISWTKQYQPDYTPPSSDGNCYPQGIAVDGRGNIYIADRGSYNGYDSSVDGIYKFDPVQNSVSAMYFTSGSSHRLFTWIYDICADDYGTVAVAGRNNTEIAVFAPGSTSADAIIKSSGYPEGVGLDKSGNVYYNASKNSDTAKNGIFRISMGHIAVTGVELAVSSKSVYVGNSFTLSAAVQPANATNTDVIYSSSNTSVATVNSLGKVTGKKPGKATITLKTVQGQKTASCQVTVSKRNNPLSIKAKTATIKYKKLKKRNQTLAVTKVINFVNKGQGTKTYKRVSGNKKITINSKTGKITVKKGLKKGTYKVKVQVRANGNANYKASAWKSVTFRIKVN